MTLADNYDPIEEVEDLLSDHDVKDIDPINIDIPVYIAKGDVNLYDPDQNDIPLTHGLADLSSEVLYNARIDFGDSLRSYELVDASKDYIIEKSILYTDGTGEHFVPAEKIIVKVSSLKLEEMF